MRASGSVRSAVTATALAGVLSVGGLAGCGTGSPEPVVRGSSVSAPRVDRHVEQRPAATAAQRRGWGAPGWQDEFGGRSLAAGWSVYDSPGHAGNGLRRPSQVRVGDGVLTQTGTAGALSAGMVMDGHADRYGRWESRIRAVPDGAGARPYHAVLALVPAGDAPYHCGGTDLDYAEFDLGAETFLFLHTLPDRQDYTSRRLDTARWHTFALEVTPTHVAWFVDGTVVATDTRRDVVPTVPMAVNLQLDAYAPAGLQPARLQLDWTRYYPLRGTATPPAAALPDRGLNDTAC